MPISPPPTLEEAREAHDFWAKRRTKLPMYRRAERKEAEEMAARWKERMAAAELKRFRP